MKIYILPLLREREIFQIDVSPTYKPLYLKMKIEHEHGLCYRNQTLIYNSVEMEDDRPFSMYRVEENDRIYLIEETSDENTRGHFELTVKDLIPKTYKVMIHPMDTVLILKLKLQACSGYFHNLQCLLWMGDQLKDSKYIKDLHLSPSTILSLVSKRPVNG